MKIIGICGRSGSGKSTVSSILRNRGLPVLDCDQIYHELVNTPSECLNAIADHFGNNFICNNKLNRDALRTLVFQSPQKLYELNKSTHPFILEELKRRLDALASDSCQIAIIDAPLFFEAGLDCWCDLVCAVVSDENLELERICKRDQISIEQAKLRISKQFSVGFLKEKSDFIIENNGNLQELELSCDKLIQTALK